MASEPLLSSTFLLQVVVAVLVVMLLCSDRFEDWCANVADLETPVATQSWTESDDPSAVYRAVDGRAESLVEESTSTMS